MNVVVVLSHFSFFNCNDPRGLSELIVCCRYCSTKIATKNKLFSLSLVCVKGNCSCRTCHSESVINNVVTDSSAQEQVGLVKPSDTLVNTPLLGSKQMTYQ